jgi:AcrR family transcriptional regulator
MARARVTAWLGLAGLLMPVGILGELYLGLSPVFVLLGAVAMTASVVTEDGFAALTTKRLAERMHFTEAALYRHFKSKEEILVTMLHHLASNIDERLASVAEAHPEPVERVRAMFDSQFTYFQKNPQYLMAIFASGLLEASHGIDAGIERIMVVKRRHLLSAIKDGQRSGAFSPRTTRPKRSPTSSWAPSACTCCNGA